MEGLDKKLFHPFSPFLFELVLEPGVERRGYELGDLFQNELICIVIWCFFVCDFKDPYSLLPANYRASSLLILQKKPFFISIFYTKHFIIKKLNSFSDYCSNCCIKSAGTDPKRVLLRQSFAELQALSAFKSVPNTKAYNAGKISIATLAKRWNSS